MNCVIVHIGTNENLLNICRKAVFISGPIPALTCGPGSFRRILCSETMKPVEILSDPGHGHGSPDCSAEGKWTSHSSLNTFHLSSKSVLQSWQISGRPSPVFNLVEDPSHFR